MLRRLRGQVGEWHGQIAGLRRPKKADDTATQLRGIALDTLNTLSRKPPHPDAPHFANVLVDGMWENPNYWTRYAMFRAALGLSEAQETGLLGPFNRVSSETAFTTLGIGMREDFARRRRAVGSQRANARRLLRNVRTADDVLKLELPYGILPEIIYDGLLKRQRRGDVDPDDPLLVDHLAEALTCLEAAQSLFAENDYDLVALSHALNFDFGALAWCALQSGATVIVLYGDFGTTRFIRIREPNDLLDYINCPTPEEMDALPADERARRAEAGTAYLETRFRGVSGDLSAAYVYRGRKDEVSREDICNRFGWDHSKPLICVYASNWFDFPHSCNMENFRDFRDWIDATLTAGHDIESVNWLFKPHPCDDWYGAVRGPTVADLVTGADSAHIQLVDPTWNGLALMHAIDGAVTYYGTIGIEMAAIGKPALTADRGWYTAHGVAKNPGDRSAYLAMLGHNWWEELDAETAASRAREFIGWYFCDAEWHGDYHFRDDSEQAAIYADLPAYIAQHHDAIARETETIGKWIADGHRYYHTFKMMESRVAIETPERHIGYVRDEALAANLEMNEAP